MSPGEAPGFLGERGGSLEDWRSIVGGGGLEASLWDEPLQDPRVCPSLTAPLPLLSSPFVLRLASVRSLTPSDVASPGQNEGTISVVEGETLYVIEEDKGDGWTRIRRNEDEEGYVPTSYVEVYLDKNAKGAKTYI